MGCQTNPHSLYLNYQTKTNNGEKQTMNEKMKIEMIEWVTTNKIKHQYILSKIGSFCREYGYTMRNIKENQEIYEWVYNYVKKIERIKKDF